MDTCIPLSDMNILMCTSPRSKLMIASSKEPRLQVHMTAQIQDAGVSLHGMVE